MILPKIYKIEEIGKGFLAVMAKPRSGEWIEDEFLGLKNSGVTIVVSMLEAVESYQVGLQSESEHCQNNSIEFLSFPVPDRGLPANAKEFEKLTEYLHTAIHQGAGVTIHCRAGIGRSGILSAAVLIKDGFSTKAALEKISEARRVSVPDTEEQVKWLQENELLLQRKT